MANNRDDGDDGQYARAKVDERKVVGGNAGSDKKHSQSHCSDKHLSDARDRACGRESTGGAGEIQRCSFGRFAALGAELRVGGDRG